MPTQRRSSTPLTPAQLDRACGVALGGAVGDALGAPYEFVQVEIMKGAHKQPEYLAKYPHGRVPYFEDDGTVILESCAAVMYLADKFADEKLAPPADGGSVPAARLRQVGAMAQFVRENHRADLRIADIAGAVHLTPSHAMTVFRRTAGVTLGQYVTMCRVAEAQRLLLTTPLRVTEIADAAGFGSLSSFYEHVTAACGMTPREYRRQGR